MAFSSSLWPAIQTLTVGIAAVLTLGACGSPLPGLTVSAIPAQPTSGATPAASRAVTTKAPRPVAAPTQVSVPAAGPDLTYVKLQEPFSTPGKCNLDGTTLEMADCSLRQVVVVDATVDRLQRQRFESAGTSAEQRADLRDDAQWLKDRAAAAAANPTGGTIDQILEAQALLKVSQERVSSLASGS